LKRTIIEIEGGAPAAVGGRSVGGGSAVAIVGAPRVSKIDSRSPVVIQYSAQTDCRHSMTNLIQIVILFSGAKNVTF